MRICFTFFYNNTASELTENLFRELAESNGIKVSVETYNILNVDANLILLESLISNLIVNAIRHNNKDVGIIDIILDGKIFSISNTGQPEPLNPDKIFRRFSRTSEEKEGNGLGLSIVHQICLLHKWEIEYQYQDKRHIFTLQFI